MRRAWLRSVIVLVLLGALAGCAAETVAGTPPPPPAPVTEAAPTRPDRTSIWVAGHWAWRQRVNAYVWVPGRWDTPPSPGSVWAPGHWAARGDGYTWVEGQWEQP